jgi:ornithine carbamoyltransferase
MPKVTINTKHLLSVTDLAPAEIRGLVERARDLKGAANTAKPLQGKTVALLFEKPSLRTRVSFEVAITNLGGNSLYLSPQEVGVGGREAVSDVAQVLSRYVDCIVYRCFEHKNLEELAQYATVPVINALSEDEHPCQTLADLTTMLEHRGSLDRTILAYIGDGNNVARSLAYGAASVGMTFRIASPPGYELTTPVLKQAAQIAAANGGQIEFLRDPVAAVEDANVVYTDVWASMGQEGEAGERKEAFIGYQVNPELMEQAAPDAIFMHDLPAHYGEEVPKGFLGHPQSVVFDQAENRLHAQQALLEALIG